MKENVLVKLYKSVPRQVPGHDGAIDKALRLTGLDLDAELAVLNIGCGTGAQTLRLAKLLPHAQIAAIDDEQSFLDELNIRKSSVKGAKIQTVKADPELLPIQKDSVDLIWSEAVVKNTGFLETLHYWKQFLKPSGVIVMSDLSWLTNERPKELEEFWKTEYPDMGTIARKTGQIQRCGLIPKAHFILPEEGWTDNYFDPLLERTPSFLDDNKRLYGTLGIVTDLFKEMNMYSKYNHYYSYVYYIMSKI